MMFLCCETIFFLTIVTCGMFLRYATCRRKKLAGRTKEHFVNLSPNRSRKSHFMTRAMKGEGSAFVCFSLLLFVSKCG